MNTGQILSIVAAIVVAAIVVGVSVMMNMPKTIVAENDTNRQNNNNQQTNERFSLRDLISSVTK